MFSSFTRSFYCILLSPPKNPCLFSGSRYTDSWSFPTEISAETFTATHIQLIWINCGQIWSGAPKLNPVARLHEARGTCPHTFSTLKLFFFYFLWPSIIIVTQRAPCCSCTFGFVFRHYIWLKMRIEQKKELKPCYPQGLSSFGRLVRWSILPPFRFHLTCIGFGNWRTCLRAGVNLLISTLTLVCGDGRSAVSTHLPHPFHVSPSTLPFHLPLQNYTAWDGWVSE